MEWILELALIGLLLATMFHAVRLERALGVLKRDRAALEELVTGFNASTMAAEQGIARLKEAADGAGRQIARQVDAAGRLKDDLVFLSERGGAVADRLDAVVRAARAVELSVPPPPPSFVASATPAPSAPLSPLAALARHEPSGEPQGWEPPEPQGWEAPAAAPRARSQAERDLMRALKLAR